jgi:hypothetical protein
LRFATPARVRSRELTADSLHRLNPRLPQER